MIEVVRLSHRLPRDIRITTHCALTARAFGATKFIYGGQKDKGCEMSVTRVTEEFGGPFEIIYEKNIVRYLKEKKKEGYHLVHLTMYGLPIEKKIQKIRQHKNILFIIGGERVEGEIYHLAHDNIAVTQQPHSEVMAIGYALDYYSNRKMLNKKFTKAKKEIIPQERGKKIEEFTSEKDRG